MKKERKHDIYCFVTWVWKMKYFQLFIIKQYKMFYDSICALCNAYMFVAI